MLTSIELKNYRGFEQYRLNGLSRVNLLVGKNGCGKTTVLEAMYLLASKGDPAVLTRLAEQRGEMILNMDDLDRLRPPVHFNVSHLFHGHEFSEQSSFHLSSDGEFDPLTIRVVNFDDLDAKDVLLDDMGGVRPNFALECEIGEHRKQHKYPLFGVSEEGMVSLNMSAQFRHLKRRESLKIPAIQIHDSGLAGAPHYETIVGQNCP